MELTQDSQRFAEAIRRFDEENARDPNMEMVDGRHEPRELVYARWLTEWVLRLAPDATEDLRLAARCQHLCRWLIPRESYPMTRAGYLKWRQELKLIHARRAGEVLRGVGYPEDLITRVQELNLKKNFPHDGNSRIIEDALCLVFLEHQFPDLAKKTAEEKLINALQKSWKKMTQQGRAAAFALSYGEKEKQLLDRALSGEAGTQD